MERYTLIVLAVLILSLGYFIASTNASKRNAFEHTIDSFEARTLEDMATSGARIVINKLSKDPQWRDDDYRMQFTGTQVDVEITDYRQLATLNQGEVLVTSTASLTTPGTERQKHATTKVTMITETVFTNNAWVIDDLGATNLANGVHIIGNFHTNHNLNIAHSPEFDGNITVTGNINIDTSSPAYPNVGYHDLIDVIEDFSDLTDPAVYTRKLVGDHTLEFNGDGTVSIDGIVWSVNDGTILYATGDLTVSGQVDRNVTLYSEGSIYIPNDIRYTDKTSDMLTMICEDDLLIRAIRDSTIVINANMFTGGANGVRLMTDRNHDWSATHMAYFEIFGSLVQMSLQPLHLHRSDIPFGTSSASDARFSWIIDYDERLDNQPPAGMPQHLRIISWQDL